MHTQKICLNIRLSNTRLLNDGGYTIAGRRGRQTQGLAGSLRTLLRLSGDQLFLPLLRTLWQ